MGVTIAWGGWGSLLTISPRVRSPGPWPDEFSLPINSFENVSSSTQASWRQWSGFVLRSGLPQSGDPALSEHLIQANESGDANEAVCLDLALSACESFPCACAVCKAKVDVTVSYHRYAHMGTVIMTEEIMLITRVTCILDYLSCTRHCGLVRQLYCLILYTSLEAKAGISSLFLLVRNNKFVHLIGWKLNLWGESKLGVEVWWLQRLCLCLCPAHCW